MPFPWWHFAMLVAMVSADDVNESWDSDYNETNWTQPVLSPCGAQRPPETYDPLAEAHDPGPASLGKLKLLNFLFEDFLWACYCFSGPGLRQNESASTIP